MAIEIDAWSAAMLLTKWFSYICFVSLAGGIYALRLDVQVAKLRGRTSTIHALFSFRPFLISLACLGVLLSAAALFFQVGAINQNGIAGMFDWFMVQLIAQSNIGGGNALRALGFLLLAISCLGLESSKASHNFNYAYLAAYTIGLFTFIGSFAYLGHIAPLTWIAKGAIVLHVGAVGLWLGALLPLWLMCGRADSQHLLPLMKAFGDWGWWIIASLVLAGGYLVITLIASPKDLISTPYGLLLIAKLLLALCLLALAASNKFILVARLASGAAQSLRRSIAGEMALALIILFITAALTTFTGPMAMAA